MSEQLIEWETRKEHTCIECGAFDDCQIILSVIKQVEAPIACVIGGCNNFKPDPTWGKRCLKDFPEAFKNAIRKGL